MRIGIVTHAYYPHYGGVTENVAGSAAALRARGHRVTVVTAGPPVAGDDHDIVRLGKQCMVPWNGATVSLTYGARLGSRLAALFRRLRFDVVHAHCPLAPTLPLAAVRAAAQSGVPVVGTFHASASWNIGYHLFQGPLRRDFDRLDRKLAVSRAAVRFAKRYFPGTYEVVPNGVDVERFHPAASPTDLGPRRPTVVYVGRLDPRKGVEHLIDAMPLLARSVKAPRLVIVGDGPRRRRLETRARRRARGLVDFRGPVSIRELPGYFTAADVVCCPATHNESFGIVLLEAMASGRAIVATDIPGYRLLVQEGVTGRTVPPGDAAALAAALGELLADAALARRLATRGRELAWSYRWQVVGEKLEAIYEALTGVPGPAVAPAALAIAEPV